MHTHTHTHTYIYIYTGCPKNVFTLIIIVNVVFYKNFINSKV